MSRLAPYKRRVLRWLFVASVVVSATTLLMWALSLRWSLTYFRLSPAGRFELRTHDGSFFIVSDYRSPTTAPSRGLQAPPVATSDPWPVSMLPPVSPPTRLSAPAARRRAAAIAAAQTNAVAARNEGPSFLGLHSVRVPDEFEVEVIPLWAPLLMLALFQAWWLTHYYGRRLRETRSGTCIECGYDLRASLDRCPECGHPIGFGRVQALSARAHLRPPPYGAVTPPDASATSSSSPP